MKNLTKLPIFLLFLALATSLIGNSQAETFTITMTTIKVAGKMYFDSDVKKHYEATRLNEDAEAKLFLMAGKDWDKYQKLKDETFKKQFKTILKEFTYLKTLHYDATKRQRYGRSQKQSPKFFKVNQDDYFKLVQENETTRLKEYLKKPRHIGIVKGRIAFVDEVLKPKGYPHKASESNDDIYWRWYNAEKRRIKSEIFVAHAKQYEFHRSLEVIHSLPRRDSFGGGRDNPLRGIYIRPTDLHDFFKGAEQKIDELLVDKELNQSQVAKVLEENPGIGSILKKLEVLTPKDFPIANYASDTNKFEQVKSELIENLGKQLNQSLIDRVLKYSDTAFAKSQKYSRDQLLKLRKQSLERFAFAKQGDYSALMGAYIYDLGAALKDHGKEAYKDLRDRLETQLQSSFQSLLNAMSNNQFYLAKGSKEFLLDTLVGRFIGSDLLEAMGNQDHQQRFVDMASWIVKFEAKRVSHQFRSTVVIETHAYNTFEGQEAASKFLRAREFDRGREKFRQDLRQYYNGFLQINIDSGKEIFSGRSAIDFILSE